jgi:Arm DNA-binding domain
MVHVRTLLDTRRARFDGSFNIIYRITHYKKVYTLSSGISIPTHYWNSQSSEIDRTHRNAARLNLKLSKRFFEIQRAILELEDHFSIEELKAVQAVGIIKEGTIVYVEAVAQHKEHKIMYRVLNQWVPYYYFQLAIS